MSVYSGKTVCVVGLGYIGLPTATFIARGGLRVVGVDINSEYVEKINAGAVPFFEPDFEQLLCEVVDDGRLTAQIETPSADVYIVAVPTPFKDGHEVDDKYIMTAGKNIASKLTGGELIVLESTSPPGTTESLAKSIIADRPELTLTPGSQNSLYFAHCPERVLPGKIVEEMSSNDRVVGGLNEEAAELARQLYEVFCDGKILVTDATTAEMAKLTENSFRDVNIAFANELARIAEELNIDVWELISIANHHPRVNILNPGPGVGGHCIAVDPWFIVSSAPESAKLIRLARELNDQRPEEVVNSVLESVAELGHPAKIAALGLAFKADIDDLRESPAIEIVKKLSAEDSIKEVLVVEPNIETLPKDLEAETNLRLENYEDAIAEADFILVLVDHREFLNGPPALAGDKPYLDTRGVWSRA